jgi:tRNA (adenine37-N6)-methyltransferase
MYTLRPIGWVRSDRTAPEDDNWDQIRARIELDESWLSADALTGLDGFSHVEVIFLFDRVPDDRIETGARHPRNRTDWPKAGIFAQRGKNRPNRLGATICRLVSLEGSRLYVEGLDAIDATPVLDLKPVMTGFLPRGPVHEPDWARDIMSGYW